MRNVTGNKLDQKVKIDKNEFRPGGGLGLKCNEMGMKWVRKGREGSLGRPWVTGGGSGMWPLDPLCGRWRRRRRRRRNGQVGWAVVVARAGEPRPVPDPLL